MRRNLTLILTAALIAGLATGCTEKKDNAVPVQSVAMLCGLTDAMQQQVFAGVVSTGNEANIKKDGNKKVAKVNVKKGDLVKAGDVLFVYDAEQAQNSLDKAKLELEEMKNALESKNEEKEQLEKDKKRAKQDDQLEYTLKIQETATEIRETEYNIGLKEKEILKLEEGTKNLDVTAPFDGRIEKAGTADLNTTEMFAGDDMEEDLGDFDLGDDGSGEVFIKLVETDNYRVKGTINETNINVISVGMEMVIHSRVDDTATWKGTVSEIDTKAPASGNQNNMYSGGDDGDDAEMTTSSKYPFYVKLDALEGLMIGQHVYMTEDLGEDENGDEIRLSSAFIVDADTEPWVWVEDSNAALAKRPVVIGAYIAEDDTYVIDEGLGAEDYIAMPSENYKEGMPVTENDESAFEADENMEDFYGEDGEGFGGEEGFDDEEGADDEDFADDDFGGGLGYEEIDDAEYDDEGYDEDFDDEDFDDEDFDDEDFEDEDDGGFEAIEERYAAVGEEIVG